jgi:prepilin-type processing-associated H-X9-DG protein
MPFTEESSRYDAASDGDRNNITTRQHDAIREVVVNPLPLADCPSRRPGMIFPKPVDGLFIAHNSAKNPSGGNVAGRTDYAINAGDNGGEQPDGYDIDCWSLPMPGMGLTPKQNYNSAIDFKWPTGELGWTIPTDGSPRVLRWTGVSFQRSEVGVQHVTDGTSHTYLIGEKFLRPARYETGTDGGDNETWCTGFNNDNFRSAFDPPARDRDVAANLCCQGNIFGSAHSAGFYMSWCDGHVQMVGEDVDLQVHRANAHRADGGQPNTTPPNCPGGGI